MSNPSSTDRDVPASGDADAVRSRLFEERYGPGTLEELTRLFARPCVTYAEIAKRFGVTRERVRQWHLSLAPDSPRGHERRRLCQSQQQRRRLLDDPVYRAFVRAARTQYPNASVQPVPSKTGLLKRIVRFGSSTIALKRAGTARPRRGERHTMSYSLTGSRAKVDFLFFQLPGDAYVLLPAELMPPSGTTFLDSTGSRYYAFKNVFVVSPSPDAASADEAAVVKPASHVLHQDGSDKEGGAHTERGGSWCHCDKA